MHWESHYRWYILSLGTITHIMVAAMPLMCMPVLFKEISDDLRLDLVQLGLVWGIAALPGLFGAFAVGLISDKYGSARTLGITCLLQGVAGALRGLSDSFATLAISMFIFGLFSIPLSLATHKAAGAWFSPKQLGLANGILATGFGAGNMLGAMVSATFLSPLLGGWRNLMFVYGAVAIIAGIFWLRARREPAAGNISAMAEPVPFRRALTHVIRLKSVWLIALFQMCLTGYSGGLMGYLPLYLRSVGWIPATADSALATFGAVSILGAIPLSMLSDRIGRRKVILYGALLSVIVGVSLLSMFTDNMVWVGVVLAGISQEVFFAVSITILIETKGIGAAYAGTALGLAGTLASFGGFFSPPIGNRLAEIEPSFAFFFWLSLAVAALLVFRYVNETGWRQ